MRVHGPVRSRCPGSRCAPPTPYSDTAPAQPRVRVEDPSTSPSQSTPPSDLLPPRNNCKIIRRIPKNSRDQAARKLASILNAVVAINDHASWSRLLCFASRCLRVPLNRSQGRQGSLVSAFNKQLADESDPLSSSNPVLRPSHRHDPSKFVAARVSAKLEEGDFKGAVRLASSDDRVADMSSSTYAALQAKHPPPHPLSSIPELVDVPDEPISISAEAISLAIRSFPHGSAGGPDGLRPQHLKDLIGTSAIEGSASYQLLTALSSFANLVLEGRTPPSIRPAFFGASLIALEKKGGGIRPIAVGSTLRRLVAKAASAIMKSKMSALLAPTQLGFGIKGGVDAAIHAARYYLHHLTPHHAVVKLDFRNAFNSVRRDKMLNAVLDLAPELFHFVHSVYSSPSNLYWGDKIIHSEEGVQQGDPLGPLLFCLTIFRIQERLESELPLLYLDDITLGGSLDQIKHDLRVIEEESSALGLDLNPEKSEIICSDPQTITSLLSLIPGAIQVAPSAATLLGSSVGDMFSVSSTISEKTHMLKTMGERLHHLSSHDAILLLRHSLAIPKLLHILRTSPCFISPVLKGYEEELCSILSAITNTQLEVDSPAWSQATLPVDYGGLGVRSAAQLSTSAFLASTAASSTLVHQILPPRLLDSPLLHVTEAKSLWSLGHDQPPPIAPASHHQRSWDSCKVQATFDTLLASAPDSRSRARLLAAACKGSGAWLNVLPISSLGLRMDDDCIRIAVGLRLGTTLCSPHDCCRCGNEVDHLGTHGLSCRQSEGRHHRHAAVNDIIHRALSTAKIPSRLEPSGLYRSDGKRPDGASVVPWKSGKLLVWDATCPDTFAPSYNGLASSEAGLVAAQAEERKRSKYLHLSPVHLFLPVAIETSGVVGPQSKMFLKELGRRMEQATGEPLSRAYLFQRLSVAIQRGNAASVLGSSSTTSQDFEPDYF